MPCFHPVQASLYQLTNGKQKVSFTDFRSLQENQKVVFPAPLHVGSDNEGRPLFASSVRFVWLPCGKCDSCLMNRARQWALRCMHEASKTDKNCFITLTYDNDHLPSDNSLHLDHLQKFFKRLRKKFGKCRYFACGEYGSKGSRPHYHAIIFGLDFSACSRSFDEESKRSFIVSEDLKSLWSFGFSSVGECNFQTCAYVARYCVKKIPQKRLDGRHPEFVVMSSRPGIGHDFCTTYSKQILDNDFILYQGKQYRPPRYYDKIHEKNNSEKFANVKEKRMSSIEPIDWDELYRSEVYQNYIKSLRQDRKI